MSRRPRPDVVTPKRTDGIPLPTGRPVFYAERPAGAYGSPHAAPVVNRRTMERHPLQCRCEKCEPGSGCQCYACCYEATQRIRVFAAMSKDHPGRFLGLYGYAGRPLFNR